MSNQRVKLLRQLVDAEIMSIKRDVEDEYWIVWSGSMDGEVYVIDGIWEQDEIHAAEYQETSPNLDVLHERLRIVDWLLAHNVKLPSEVSIGITSGQKVVKK